MTFPWRTSVLLALLFLIALILVLPQVDLPDVTSDMASVGVVRAHVASASLSALGAPLLVARLRRQKFVNPVSSRLTSETWLSTLHTTPELRC